MKNKKSLGQHWLKNRVILEEIADLAAGATPVMEAEDWGGNADLSALAGAKIASEVTRAPLGTVCVEIGPGLGTLTSSLLRRFERVVAVEYDADLAAKLPGQFPGKALEVVNEDILEFDFSRLETEQRSGDLAERGSEEATEQKSEDLEKQGSGKGFRRGNFVVAGNIPYYITSPILEKLLNLEVAPRRIVLLVQKEVAERVANDRETLLSLMVKNRAEVALGPVVRREEFTPPPKVDSQVLVLVPHAPEVGAEVLKLAKIGFKSPRKKLVHNLAGVAIGWKLSESKMTKKQETEQWSNRLENGARILDEAQFKVDTTGPIGPEKGAKMLEKGKAVLSEQEVKKLLTEAGIDEDVRPGDLHLEDWARLGKSIGLI